MDKICVIEEIEALIKEATDIILPTKWRAEGIIGARSQVNHELYVGWHTRALAFLRLVFYGENEMVEKFASLGESYYADASSAVEVLKGIVKYVEKDFLTVEGSTVIDAEKELKLLFSRFHRVARQLRSRHENRTTIEIEDEYDVQDLLHALLRLYFDDVRPEEWTPSYAGKASRMDFLLKREKTVIEVKKTRKQLTEKELGDQLIIDIDRYKAHPDCEKLICFIYDPEGRIGNPDGFAHDLNDNYQGFTEVIIEPRN